MRPAPRALRAAPAPALRRRSRAAAAASFARQFLGWYDPLKHETQLDAPNIKKWIELGAQPSTSVSNLLKKALIIPAGEKKVYAQLSTKAAAAAKAEKAAAIKKAQAAKAAAAKEAAAAAAAAAKAAKEAAKA
jgi:small subunit ribosomal protein S16